MALTWKGFSAVRSILAVGETYAIIVRLLGKLLVWVILHQPHLETNSGACCLEEPYLATDNSMMALEIPPSTDDGKVSVSTFLETPSPCQ